MKYVKTVKTAIKKWQKNNPHCINPSLRFSDDRGYFIESGIHPLGRGEIHVRAMQYGAPTQKQADEIVKICLF
jgi:hypothetical protein